MKVSLIYARTSHSTIPPLGILYIGAVLEKAGHSVQIFDPLPIDNEYVQKIKLFQPDLIGVSFISTGLNKAKETIELIKRENIRAVLCCGGPHATAFPEDTLEKLKVDFVCFGEGEYTMKEVCSRFEEMGKFDFKGVNGVVYFINNKIIKTPYQKLVDNLDDLPFPARHLLNYDRYLAPPGHIRGLVLDNVATIITRRGCPYKCIYCAVNLVHTCRPRIRSVEDVVDEIKALIARYRIKGVWFIDDTFTANKEWVYRFCNVLLENNIRIKWGCHARVNDISEYLVQKMKDSGCVQLDIGVESGSSRILKVLKKGSTPDMIRDAFRVTKKVRIRTMASFIIGNPSETREDIEQTKKIAKEIKPDFSTFTFLTPTPGSELYVKAVENRWFNPETYFSDSYSWTWSEYPLLNCSTLDKEELKRIRSRLENRFAVRNYMNFFRNNLAFIIQLFFVVIKNPTDTVKGIKIFFRTRKISDLANSLISIYRLNAPV